MQHIKTIFAGNLNETRQNIGCGECQTSCQSACKTSCTVSNQSCEQSGVSSLSEKTNSRVNRTFKTASV